MPEPEPPKRRPYWRLGHKVQLNVYEGDRPVCQCHNAEDAYRIVMAVNAQIRKEFEETGK